MWLKTKKSIWKVVVTILPHSDVECDTNYLKVKWLDNKTEYIIFTNHLSVEYIKYSSNCRSEIFLWGSYGRISSKPHYANTTR